MIGPEDVHRAAMAGAVGVALVTDAHGSTPCEAGRTMLIWPDRTEGTIGGGTVEQEVIGSVRALLATPGPPQTLDFALNADLDQCCGGRLRVALAVCGPAEGAVHHPGQPFALWQGGPSLKATPGVRPVHVYGAGHVGTALVNALGPLPFDTLWIDERADLLAAANVATEVTPLPEAIANTAPANTAHVILTHSHALDLEIVAAVLTRPHAFCGLIGSATKAALFRRRLAERGVSGAAIARLTCPIGLPGLRDRRPAVIAASVAAQLLMLEDLPSGAEERT